MYTENCDNMEEKHLIQIIWKGQKGEVVQGGFHFGGWSRWETWRRGGKIMPYL